MVDTIKFSQFVNGGDLSNDKTTVGLDASLAVNTRFNVPWTYLAEGTTGDRPIPAPEMYYRQRFNTTLEVYEYYDPTIPLWTQLSGSGTGTVNPGVVNNIAFYAASGQAISPLASLANAVLVTSPAGVPALSTTFPAGLSLPSATITASTAALSAGSVAATPTAGTDIANKAYVDAALGGLVDSVTGTGNEVDVDNTDPANPVLRLSATIDAPGTFSIQGTTAVSAIINDSTLATASATNVSTSAAMKAYIDTVASGLNIQGSCVAGSTTDLTVTYSNGVSGVGATLTNAGVQAAISLDGVSTTAGQRVLIKNQASTFQNGIYTVTTVGTGATNWVLTRATDFDTPAEIQPGDLVILTGGATQTNSSWIQTSTVVTVGTDAITFIQFSASVPVSVANGGTGLTSLATFRLLAGGTTSTGAMQQVVDGAAGTLLRSAGAGALAGYTTAAYPVVSGTSGNVLTSDGTNLISSPAKGIFLSQQIFTSGTALTYTKPANVTSILVEIIGGGGGGGSSTSGALTLGMGGGGGGGGYSRLWIAVAAATYTYTVGAGGAGGNGSSQAGATGSNTTFSASSMVANGGIGGGLGNPVGSTSSATSTGGGGGSSSNGTLNIPGSPGEGGIILPGVTANMAAGGSSFYGSGGVGINLVGTGSPGRLYGGGGSGGISYNSSNYAGGSGFAGVVIVWEYS